jgi:hypothetical protein
VFSIYQNPVSDPDEGMQSQAEPFSGSGGRYSQQKMVVERPARKTVE